MEAPNASSSSISYNSTTNVVISLTAAELWIQLIVFYGLLCGIVPTVCSILIWVGIFRNKELRNRFFIIVAFLTLCRTAFCLQLLFLAFFRSLRTVGIVQLNQTRVFCHFAHFWLTCAPTLELTLLCTLVIDRMIALMKSNYYRQMGDKSAFYVCLAQYIFIVAIKLIPSYVGYDMSEVVPCINVFSFSSPAFNYYAQGTDAALICLILLLYFALIAFVQHNVTRLKEAAVGDRTANVSLKRQLQMIPVLRNLIFIHCVFTTVSRAFLLAGALMESGLLAQRIAAVGGVIGGLDQLVNVLWLLIKNKDVRKAALPCSKKTEVVTIHSTRAVVAR